MKRLALAAGLPLLFAAPAQADVVVAGTDALVWDKPNVTVKPGETVRWTFPNTAQAHNVEAADDVAADPAWPAFFSPTALPAPDASYTFNVEGTFNFVCNVHRSTMFGTVTVTTGPPPPPPVVPLSAQPLANDAAGAVPMETSVAVDRTKPRLTSVAWRRNTVRFRVSEESVVSVRIRRGSRVVKSASVSGTGALRVRVRGLRAGRYVVRVRAVDLAGNRSSWRSVRAVVR